MVREQGVEARAQHGSATLTTGAAPLQGGAHPDASGAALQSTGCPESREVGIGSLCYVGLLASLFRYARTFSTTRLGRVYRSRLVVTASWPPTLTRNSPKPPRTVST